LINLDTQLYKQVEAAHPHAGCLVEKMQPTAVMQLLNIAARCLGCWAEVQTGWQDPDMIALQAAATN
jgi:hypothetical protein